MREYAAGFFDGEGNIQIRYMNRVKKNGESTIYYFLLVKITNTSIAPLQALQGIYGGKVNPLKRRSLMHRLAYEWRISSKQAAMFLEDIYPYLLIKKEQARLAIEFQKKMCYLGNGTLTGEQIAYRSDIRNRISELCGKIKPESKSI